MQSAESLLREYAKASAPWSCVPPKLRRRLRRRIRNRILNGTMKLPEKAKKPSLLNKLRKRK